MKLKWHKTDPNVHEAEDFIIVNPERRAHYYVNRRDENSLWLSYLITFSTRKRKNKCRKTETKLISGYICSGFNLREAKRICKDHANGIDRVTL